jgi:hypothetical protein
MELLQLLAEEIILSLAQSDHFQRYSERRVVPLPVTPSTYLTFQNCSMKNDLMIYQSLNFLD